MPLRRPKCGTKLSPLTPPPAAKDQLPRAAIAVAAASAATANACLTSAITKQACAVGNMDSLPRKGQDARAVSLRRARFYPLRSSRIRPGLEAWA